MKVFLLMLVPLFAAAAPMNLPLHCRGTYLTAGGLDMNDVPLFPKKVAVGPGDTVSPYSNLLLTVLNEEHPINSWIYNMPDMNSSYVSTHFPEMSLSQYGGALLVTYKENGETKALKPLGVNDDTAVQIIRDLTNKGVVFEAVPEKVVRKLQEVDPALKAEADPYQVTYMYHSENLAVLPGDKFKEKRKRVEAFKRTYPSYVFHDLRESQELFPKLKELARQWVVEKSRKTPEEAEEVRLEVESLEKALDNFKDLGLLGGAITVDGKVVAFSIGARKNKWTVTALYEKADTNYKGAYQAINQLFAEKVVVYDRFTWIDRQSNAAERKPGETVDPNTPLVGTDVKMSYHPDAVVPWYTVRRPGPANY